MIMAIIAAHKRVEIYFHLENQSELLLTCFMGLQKNVSKFAFPSIYFAAKVSKHHQKFEKNLHVVLVLHILGAHIIDTQFLGI